MSPLCQMARERDQHFNGILSSNIAANTPPTHLIETINGNISPQTIYKTSLMDEVQNNFYLSNIFGEKEAECGSPNSLINWPTSVSLIIPDVVLSNF